MDFTTNGTLGKNSTVTNGYTGETFSVAGKRGSTGIFTASGGDTVTALIAAIGLWAVVIALPIVIRRIRPSSAR